MKQNGYEMEQLSLEVERLRYYLIRMVEETGSFVDPVVVNISQLLDKKLNLWMRWNECKEIGSQSLLNVLPPPSPQTLHIGKSYS